MLNKLFLFFLLTASSAFATIVTGPLAGPSGANASCRVLAVPVSVSGTAPATVNYEIVNGVVSFALATGQYSVNLSCIDSGVVYTRQQTWMIPASGSVTIQSLIGGTSIAIPSGSGLPIVSSDPTGLCSAGSLEFSTQSNKFFSCVSLAWTVVVSGSTVTLPITEANVTSLINDLGSKLSISNNLSELTSSAATARTNLGLGSSSTQPSSAYDVSGAATTALANAQASSLQKASNLSDVANAATARTNLGLGTASTQASSAFDPSGSAATVQSSSLAKANNLSDVASPSTARTNLGLGTASIQAGTTGSLVGTTDTQSLTNKTIDGIVPATMAFVDPTSSIQTQLNSKQPSASANANNDALGAASAVLATSAQKANNLSDLNSLPSARTNLGLGSIALLNLLPTTSLATVQGNGTKVQLSTGTPVSGNCARFDVNGNVIDAGAACGTGGALPTGTPNQILATDPTGATTDAVAVRPLVALDIPALPESKITNLTTDLAGKQATISILPLANGGTGTNSPAIVGGSNIGVSGSFPDQVVRVNPGGGDQSIQYNNGGSLNGFVPSGDLVIVSGTGVGTVNGLKNVPFCTGYTPTSGQSVQFTTASTPNPCYTAATATGATLPTGTPNQILATDPTGTATDTVAVRALVAADIPSLPYGNMSVTTGTGAPSASGTAGQSWYFDTSTTPETAYVNGGGTTWLVVPASSGTAQLSFSGALGSVPPTPSSGVSCRATTISGSTGTLICKDSTGAQYVVPITNTTDGKIPQSSVTNLTADLDGKQATIGFTPQNAATANSNNDSLGAASTVLGTSAQKSNNLSDLGSASTARINLGLGSAATSATSAFDASGAASTVQAASLQTTNNLSELSGSPSSARTNLGLGSIATLTVPSGTVVGSSDTQTLTNKTIDGVTSATMAFVDPTSSIQTQMNGKQSSSTADANNELPLTFSLPLVRTSNTITAPAFVASGTGHAAGSVPDPGATAGTTRFLREDGTFNIPAGGGSGASLSAANTYTTAGAASTATDLFTGALFTGGTATTTFPYKLYQPTGTSAVSTWNVNGTFIGINANSAFNGNFLDFHNGGGSSLFKVGTDGSLTTAGSSGLSATNVRSNATTGLQLLSTNNLGIANQYSVQVAASAAGSITNSTGSWNPLQIITTYNQTATASSADILINRTETTVGSGSQYFQDWQVAGTSKAHLDDKGNIAVSSVIAVGTVPTISGCSATIAGKSTAGTITSGTSGTCTPVLTFSVTAPTGWSCGSSDMTSANLFRQTATSTTTATFSGTTTSGDSISYFCMAY